jgi:putative SOS response-associated peptidase YedK
LGIAGLWASWKSPTGWVHSFTMLTINADEHGLMENFHKSTDEKRMVVILPQDSYDAWLGAAPEGSMDFMRQYPAEHLQAVVAQPVPRAVAD